jgi:hypothetical protein
MSAMGGKRTLAPPCSPVEEALSFPAEKCSQNGADGQARRQKSIVLRDVTRCALRRYDEENRKFSENEKRHACNKKTGRNRSGPIALVVIFLTHNVEIR